MIPWRLTLTHDIYSRLHAHLFCGDGDEHGAVILAGVARSEGGVRLIARELHLAVDGIDYVPGQRGYRMLRAEFIRERILRARELRLAYLAVHNHGGTDRVGFSADDLRSHERGYPALLDIARGMPVGALVLATNAIAGDLWFPDRERSELSDAVVIGQRRQTIAPAPLAPPGRTDGRYDRQARLFGDAGQELLAKSRVGIIGLGGAGSVLAELLGRLGVGEFLLVDPDATSLTNLPRLIAAEQNDAPVTDGTGCVRAGLPKVKIAERNIRRANPRARVTVFQSDFLEQDVARHFTECDYLFLAADTMSARLLFNAVVHQYGVPGVQVGAKVPVSWSTGAVGDVFAVMRTVLPGQGCLWCNGLISPARLQQEALPEEIRRAQAYVDEPEVVAPSVITLNAIACSHAADMFLFHMTGLANDSSELGWFRWNSRRGEASRDIPRRDTACLECSISDQSRFARGDGAVLPVRPS